MIPTSQLRGHQTHSLVQNRGGFLPLSHGVAVNGSNLSGRKDRGRTF